MAFVASICNSEEYTLIWTKIFHELSLWPIKLPLPHAILCLMLANHLQSHPLQREVAEGVKCRKWPTSRCQVCSISCPVAPTAMSVSIVQMLYSRPAFEFVPGHLRHLVESSPFHSELIRPPFSALAFWRSFWNWDRNRPGETGPGGVSADFPGEVCSSDKIAFKKGRESVGWLLTPPYKNGLWRRPQLSIGRRRCDDLDAISTLCTRRKTLAKARICPLFISTILEQIC